MSLRDELGYAPLEQEYFPTRNDPLNAHLGGGLLVGAVNHIYGSEGMFKSTFCAEFIADIIAAGGWMIVHDREGRLNSVRLRTVGANVKSENLIYRTNHPYTLTIDRCFEHATECVSRIRALDLETLLKKVADKKCPEKLKAALSAHLGLKRGTVGDIEKALDGKPHLLPVEHMSLIGWVLDSVTALPATDELVSPKEAKNKQLSSDDDYEAALRGGGLGSNRLGLAPQAWSTSFRNAVFVDPRVCGLVTAQTRMRGIGEGNAYEDAAEPGALKFYTRTRMLVYPMTQGALVTDTEGNLVMKNDQITAQTRPNRVGMRLYVHVKKTMAASEFRVPAFYLGATGLDRINTVWEYLLDRKLIEYKHGKYFTLKVDPLPKELADVTLSRDAFVKELYVKHLAAWAGIVRAQVQKAITL